VLAHVPGGAPERDVEQPALAVAADHEQVGVHLLRDLDDQMAGTAAEAKNRRDRQALAHQGRDVVVHLLGHRPLDPSGLLLAEARRHVGRDPGRDADRLVLVDGEHVEPQRPARRSGTWRPPFWLTTRARSRSRRADARLG